MRAGFVIAAVLLLAACSGAPQSSSPSPAASIAPRPSPTGAATPAPTGAPAASPSPGSSQAADEGWRQLASDLWLDDPFSVSAAVNQGQLEQLWTSLAQPSPPPEIDFATELVLFLGMSGSSSCPERLTGLLVDHAAATVQGQWAAHDPDQACTDDLQAQGVLLAVDRSLLPAMPFMFSLRDQPICPACPEQTDRMLVDPAG